MLDEGGHPVAPGELGAIAIKLPLPPGTLPTLWNAEDRFRKSYLEQFPGYYASGDAGYMDEDGYVYIMARTDDVINVAGHRLSTGGMEEVLASHHRCCRMCRDRHFGHAERPSAAGLFVPEQGGRTAKPQRWSRNA